MISRGAGVHDCYYCYDYYQWIVSCISWLDYGCLRICLIICVAFLCWTYFNFGELVNWLLWFFSLLVNLVNWWIIFEFSELVNCFFTIYVFSLVNLNCEKWPPPGAWRIIYAIHTDCNHYIYIYIYTYIYIYMLFKYINGLHEGYYMYLYLVLHNI